MLLNTIRRIIGGVATVVFCANAQAAVTLGTFELTSEQEVPPSTSVVVGVGDFSVNDIQTRLTLLLQFTGAIDLDGLQTPGNTLDDLTGLHIHHGAAGSNGAVVFNVLANPSTLVDAENKRVLSLWDGATGSDTAFAEHFPKLLGSELYVNVHTAEFPAGAIRGQLTFPRAGPLVPEPSTILLALGGLGFCLMRRVRK